MVQRETDVFGRLERFYDAVPRADARAEDFGGLVLFVREGPGWPFYARPRPGGGTPSAADITAARQRQRELGLPESFEWVHETTPDLLAVARSAGLEVLLAPLMVLETAALLPDLPVTGATIRLLDPHSPAFGADLAASRAVAQLGFGAPHVAATGGAHAGTAPAGGAPPGGPSPAGTSSPGPSAGTSSLGPSAGGPSCAGPPSADASCGANAALVAEPAGPAQRDAVPPPGADLIEAARERALAGRVVTGVVDSPTDGILASGIVQRVGDVAEIAGVATLPSARRLGYASQLTATLARDALLRDVHLVFLSAGDDDAARLYSRVGFRRVGTACIADPAPAGL